MDQPQESKKSHDPVKAWSEPSDNFPWSLAGGPGVALTGRHLACKNEARIAHRSPRPHGVPFSHHHLSHITDNSPLGSTRLDCSSIKSSRRFLAFLTACASLASSAHAEIKARGSDSTFHAVKAIISSAEKSPTSVAYTSLGEIDEVKVRIVAVSGITPTAATLKNGTALISHTPPLATKGDASGDERALIDFMLRAKGPPVVMMAGLAPVK